MTVYARRRERRSGITALAGAGLSAAGRAATRNPLAVGGTTAFLIALSFVSANAVWYQPQPHPSAFVTTREKPTAPSRPQTEAEPPHPTEAPRRQVRQITPGAEPAETEASQPEPQSTGSVAPDGGDPTVRAVQGVLQQLGLYTGEIDGKTGPQTHEAVEKYRRIVGLEPGHAVDSDLLDQLGLTSQGTPALDEAPAPLPVPRPSQEAGGEVQTASLDNGDPTVERVQAGLKAFGNDGIEVDGLLGENTRSAIREFQSLFGLPVTGKPDDEFLAKMREVGLIN